MLSALFTIVTSVPLGDVVTIPAVGTFKGFRNSVYLNIPYAQAPVGKLRFQPPQPALPRSGIQDATRYGFGCIQNPTSGGLGGSGLIQNEDCLNLNVFIPSTPKRKPLPVVVYVHGGGFNSGYAAHPYFDPCAVHNSYITVTFNYRVGIFGFLASSHLNKDQTNLGLRDQEFVFRWVHKHILLFGGDPQSIVAYGQSAGAISVATHMMRNTQPYFHKAILHSGGPGLFMPPNLDTFYNIVLQKTGCVTLDCLRGRDAQELYLLSIGVQFFPYIDGSFIKERPKTLFARKQVWDIPVMINTVAKEGQLFTRSVIDDTMALGFVNAQFGFLNSVQKEELFRLYPRKEFSTPSEWVGEMYGDAGFTCPAWMVHQYMKQSFRTYFDLNGSLHGSDLPYFWDYKPQVVDKNLSNRMMNLLDRFVNNQKLKEFRNKDTLSLVTMKLVKDEDKAKKCRFWTNV